MTRIRASEALLQVLIALAALLGAALTAMGLASMDWPSAIPWVPAGGATRFAAFLAAVLVTVAVASHVSRRTPFVVGAALFGAIALAAGGAWPVIVVVWMCAAFAVAGRAILASSGMVDEPGWLVCGVIGAGAYGTLIGLLAHFPVNHPAVYSAALAIPLLAAPHSLARLAADVAGRARRAASADGPRGGHRLDIAVASLAVVFATVALMPELGHDALAQHLFVPMHLASTGRWAFDVSAYTWAVMPMLADWLYALGCMLAGETAARLVNVVSALAVAGLVRGLAAWAGAAPVGARWAALLFLSSPMTFTEVDSLFVESPWAMFVVTGVLAILRSASDGERGRSWLVVAGLALGFALGAKAVTLVLLPVLLVVVLTQYRAWVTRAAARLVCVSLGLLVAVGSIPYVTAWALTANPVFPFANAVFRSPLWMITGTADPRYPGGVSWDLLYRITFHTNVFMESDPGAAGFHWLLVLLPAAACLAVARHGRGLELLLLGVASFVPCFHETAYLRYVFPVHAILAAAAGPALDTLAGVAAGTTLALRVGAALAVALNVLFLSAGPFVYRDFPLESLLGKAQKDDYLAQRMPIRRLVEVVNALNDGRSPVAMVSSSLGAGLSGRALYTNWYSRPWTLALVGAQNKQEMKRVLESYGVEYVIVDDTYQFPKRSVHLLESVTTPVAGMGTIAVRRYRRQAPAAQP